MDLTGTSPAPPAVADEESAKVTQHGDTQFLAHAEAPHPHTESRAAKGPIGAVWPGNPYPRGATWDGEGVNFSLFSANAEKVELCVFDSVGRRELQRIELKERTD